jgi:tRNA-splicing ligase RtcB
MGDRIMSCIQAKRTFAGQDIKATLCSQGFKVKATHPAMLAEEAPQVYKPSNQVADVVHNLGIATKVAKLVPSGVSKG